ncbi:uncharacterized protein LOC144296128 [Canis aureus]
MTSLYTDVQECCIQCILCRRRCTLLRKTIRNDAALSGLGLHFRPGTVAGVHHVSVHPSLVISQGAAPARAAPAGAAAAADHGDTAAAPTAAAAAGAAGRAAAHPVAPAGGTAAPAAPAASAASAASAATAAATAASTATAPHGVSREDSGQRPGGSKRRNRGKPSEADVPADRRCQTLGRFQASGAPASRRSACGASPSSVPPAVLGGSSASPNKLRYDESRANLLVKRR